MSLRFRLSKIVRPAALLPRRLRNDTPFTQRFLYMSPPCLFAVLYVPASFPPYIRWQCSSGRIPKPPAVRKEIKCCPISRGRISLPVLFFRGTSIRLPFRKPHTFIRIQESSWRLITINQEEIAYVAFTPVRNDNFLLHNPYIVMQQFCAILFKAP